jgi:hypothetical protein
MLGHSSGFYRRKGKIALHGGVDHPRYIPEEYVIRVCIHRHRIHVRIACQPSIHRRPRCISHTRVADGKPNNQLDRRATEVGVVLHF